MLIGSNIIKVNYVTSGGSAPQSQHHINPPEEANGSGLPTQPVAVTVDLDRVDDDAGLRINAQNRITLMRKLASSAQVTLPIAQMPTMSVQIPGQSGFLGLRSS